MGSWAQLTQRLGEVPALETRWLNHLVSVVGGVNSYIRLLERWQTHLDHVASNLRLTKEQRLKVVSQTGEIKPFLDGQEFELGYLQWVVSDAITELTALIDQTEELVLEFPSVLEAIRELECEHLRSGFLIVEGFSEDFRQNLYRHLNNTLTKAYISPTPQQIKQLIAKYFDYFKRIRASQSFFIDADGALTGFTAEELKERINLFDIIQWWKQDIEELVDLRATIYTSFIKHEFTIISAILPKEQNYILWLRDFFAHPEKGAITFFPTTCDNALLQIATRQSLDQLSEVTENVVRAQSILKDKSLLLALDYLRSPPLKRFLDAELKRIELFFSYSEQFVKRLEAL
ncbi:MAG: hypothetical protein ACFFCO_09795, partial [Promethearchaeota archaeon]